MMKPSQHKQYTAADIIRYHEGKMSFEEMNKFEQSALEDPLLADAIDGYENKKNIKKDLAGLRDRLHDRSDNKTRSVTGIRKLYTSISIAASLLVIFTIAFFYFNKKAAAPVQYSDNNVAEKQSTSISSNNSITHQQFSGADSLSSNKTNDNIKKNEIQLQQQIQLADNNMKFLKKNDSHIAVTEAPSPISDNISDAETESITQKFNRDDKMEIDFSNQLHTDSVTSFAVAANTNVNINDKPVSVAKGKQALPAAANIANNADMQMQEVVVSGNASNRRKSYAANTQAITAKDLKIKESKPESGMTAFEQYVNANKTSCLDKYGNEIHGIVELKFKINKDGRPEKVKVSKSLSEACDQQAIQLLEKGPKWISDGKKQTQVSISL